MDLWLGPGSEGLKEFCRDHGDFVKLGATSESPLALARAQGAET